MTDAAAQTFNGTPHSRLSVETTISRNALSESRILDESVFIDMLCLERKRAERSGRRFVLMLLTSGDLEDNEDTQLALEKVLVTLSPSIRDTDIKGWYQRRKTVGVIFTEIGSAECSAVSQALFRRISNALSGILGFEEINGMKLSFHIFPEASRKDGAGGPVDLCLYPELKIATDSRQVSRFLKRVTDIAGSLLALILFAPLLLAIAVAVKLTSKGPVLFRQERVGQYGHRFTFLKFRSMYHASDHTIHREYVERFIGGHTEIGRNSSNHIYKIINDPRVTTVGKLLRRTSLDELPQLLNVLSGEMSMVGPRPPVPYEFAAYHAWHKKRLLAVKPGITGLWQISGRSRIKFDEMVRLDLMYARTWSVWLDLQILWRTPQAVLSGDGAY